VTLGAKIAVAILGVLIALALAVVIFGGDASESGSGPANAGRFVLLVFVLPVLLASLASVLLTRGRARLWVLRGLAAFGGIVGLYVGETLLYLLIRRQ
jgi:hypothetical protein